MILNLLQPLTFFILLVVCFCGDSENNYFHPMNPKQISCNRRPSHFSRWVCLIAFLLKILDLQYVMTTFGSVCTVPLTVSNIPVCVPYSLDNPRNFLHLTNCNALSFITFTTTNFTKTNFF